MMRKVVLHMVYQLLRLAGVLLDWLDRRTMIDEPITEGDPGARYVPDVQPRPVLRVLSGGRSRRDSDSGPNGSPWSDEPLGNDHPVTPGGLKP